MGALNFGLRPQKEFHAKPKPFVVPESKSLVNLEAGEVKLGIKYKVKGKVDISKMTYREDEMQFGFTHEHLQDLRRKEMLVNINIE